MNALELGAALVGLALLVLLILGQFNDWRDR